MRRLPASPAEIEEGLLYPALMEATASAPVFGRPNPSWNLWRQPGSAIQPELGDDRFEDDAADYVAPRRALRWN